MASPPAAVTHRLSQYKDPLRLPDSRPIKTRPITASVALVSALGLLLVVGVAALMQWQGVPADAAKARAGLLKQSADIFESMVVVEGGPVGGGLVADADALVASGLVDAAGDIRMSVALPGTDALPEEVVGSGVVQRALVDGEVVKVAGERLFLARRLPDPSRPGSTAVLVLASDLAPAIAAGRAALAIPFILLLGVALIVFFGMTLVASRLTGPQRSLLAWLQDYERAPVAPEFAGNGIEVALRDTALAALTRLRERGDELEVQFQNLQRVVDLMPVGLAVRNAAGRWFLVNDAARVLLGQQAWFNEGLDGGVNTLCYRAGTDDHYPEDALPWRRPDTGELVSVPDLEVVRNGQRLPVNVVAQYVAGVDDDDHWLVMVMRDMSALRADERSLRATAAELELALARRSEELERAVAYSRSLFEIAPFALCLLDAAGRVMATNGRFLELTGRDQHELESNMLGHWLAAQSATAFEQTVKSVADGKTEASLDVAVTFGAGGIVPVEVELRRILRDGRAMVVAAFSEHRQRRVAADSEALGHEMAASRAKTEFLTLMSHEARSPMNAILGMLRLALRTELDARQRNYLEKADRSARLLMGMLDDLTDIAQIESGQLRFEEREFSLSEVLASLVDLMAVRAEEAGVEFLLEVEQDVADRFNGDPLRLYQILSNLTSNAVELTPKGGLVRVDVRSAPESSGHTRLEFCVSDTGAGLAPEVLESIVAEHGDPELASARRYGGVGLGIAISQRLIRHMGGHLTARSAEGEGSVFTLTLDLLPGFEGAGPAIPRGTRALVVDDSPISCEIVQDQLEGMGMHADAVYSGEEALQQIVNADQTDPYRVVLLDWRMPGLDGVEVARRIRAMAELRNTPQVIMFTAGSEQDLREAVGDDVVDAILIKPVVPRTLESALLRVLQTNVARLMPGPRNVKPRALQNGSRAATEQTDDGIASTDENRFAGVRVLIVDDNEVNVELTREILTTRGFVIDAVYDGQQAVDRVRSRDFDCVLMDIQMPVMDGNAATREIRTFKTPEELPIVALSASVMEEDRRRALAAGMNDFLSKPLDVPKLFAALSRWVRLPEGTLPGAGTAAADAEATLTPKQREALAAVGIQVEEALTILGGKTALYNKMLVRFRDQYRNFLPSLSTMLEEQQIEEAARAAHSLKGVAAFSRMPDVQEAARELENAILAEPADAAALSDALERLKAVLARIMPVLDTLTAPELAGADTGNVVPIRPQS